MSCPTHRHLGNSHVRISADTNPFAPSLLPSEAHEQVVRCRSTILKHHELEEVVPSTSGSYRLPDGDLLFPIGLVKLGDP